MFELLILYQRIKFTVVFISEAGKKTIYKLSNSLTGQNEVPGNRYVLDFCISMAEYEIMICVFILSFPKAHKQCFQDDSEQNSTSNKMCSLLITGLPALAAELLYSQNRQRKLISLTL